MPPAPPFRPYASDAEVDAIGRRVLDRTLPKPEWTHAAHLTAAAWLIAGQTELDPERDMPGIIRAYNEATGVENTDTGGYHHTITLASLRAVRAFLAERPESEPLHERINVLTASVYGDKGWLLAHWTRERLFSVEARRAWVEPDLEPLPF